MDHIFIVTNPIYLYVLRQIKYGTSGCFLKAEVDDFCPKYVHLIPEYIYKKIEYRKNLDSNI